jgi:hypothetical protein
MNNEYLPVKIGSLDPLTIDVLTFFAKKKLSHIHTMQHNNVCIPELYRRQKLPERQFDWWDFFAVVKRQTFVGNLWDI